MSTAIDQKVVEMRFDNKQFERNVSTTMSTLEKLKERLNFSGASKGLENVNTAASKVDFSKLEYAATTAGFQIKDVWLKVASVLEYQVAGKIIDIGKNITSALTIDPIKTGLAEYETQINAVQTILANTESKGTTLNDVNSALDTLNTYADKTIYNFTEMTRNIGTFTAAGVDLDTSVNAIQGIANLAAVSGSSSQQASTAMYQLSQALASGTVKLMDWNSVVNAGMGGQVFQDALKETARVHGINIDAMIEREGSFRETLSTGWLSSDILTETLSHFTMAAEEGSEEWNKFKKSLMDDGYTAEQAESILKLSNTATDAATKVKTATQLYDTLKETAQSGWTQTWEIIFGDFEEAKNLFSELYETFAPILEASAKVRNELLEGWAKAGGRDDLLQSLRNVFDAIGSIVKPIKEAFRDIFPPATAKHLVNITKAIKDFTAKLKLSDTTSDNLKRTFKGLFAIVDIVRQVFVAVGKAIGPVFGAMGNLGGGILGVTAKLGDWLVGLDESIKTSSILVDAVEAIRGAFEKVKSFIEPAIEGFKRFGNAVTESLTAVSVNAKERLGPLAVLGNFVKNVFVGIGRIIEKVFPYVATAAKGIGNVLKDLMSRISDSVQNADYDSVFDLISGGIMTAIGVFIAKFMKAGSDILDNASGFLDNINGILGGVGDALGAFTDSLKADTLKKIAIAIAILAASLLVLSLIDSEKMLSSLTAVTVLFGELLGAMSIFSKIGSVKGVIKTAGALVALSTAILVLSVALKIMSTMSWDEMGVGLISLTVGLGALIAAVNLLPDRKVNGAAKAIKKLSTAVLILAIGIKIMSTMSWEEMGIGLISMVVGLAALVGAVNLLPKDTMLRAAGMVGLATAMVILAGALKIMATMSWNELAKSLVALGGSLLILAIAMTAMKKAIPGALAMAIIAPALVVLAGALKIMSGVSWDGVATGLVLLGGSLLIISAAMALMKKALPGAAALLVVAASLAVLTPVLKILGSMGIDEIGKALLMLAGVFAIFGIAGVVLRPLVPTLLGLAGALTLLGIACAAIGAGVLLAGVGLSALAVALTASGGAITVFVSSLISLIPYLIEQIGVGIIRFCDVIAGSASAICSAVAVVIVAIVDAIVASVPALVEGVFVLVEELLKSLVSHTPTIVTSLMDFLIGLLNAIAAKLPDLIQAGVNLLMAFFSGVVEALGSIDPTALVNGIMAVGVMTALMAALAAVASLTPAAMVGVLGLGAVIAELALVFAAIGALAQIPGLEWLITEGGNFMQAIGTALGQFLGGIAGGFAQGVSSVLPQIGSDLTEFMNNASGFIEGARSIDSATFDGVKSIVGIIAALTAVDMIQGLNSWFTGGSSLTKFGEEIAAFGPNIKAYADSVADIDASAISASATAAKALAEMTNCIPNEGGVVSWFAGDNSIAKFGNELISLGEGLSAYSNAIVDFDAEAVTSSANAAKAIADMTACIPNEGGVVSWFAGDNSISKFGADLIILGTSLAEYSKAIVDFDAEAVISSANAAKALADMTNCIPNEGGVVSWFAGDNSISKFGTDLVSLGESLAKYSNSIAGFDSEAVVASASAAKALAEMTAHIPNEGGVVSWFTGENSISKFGNDLISLGIGLKGFSDEVSGIAPENVIAASNAAKTLAEMASYIPDEGGMVTWFTGDNSLSKFSTDLISLGQGLKGFSDEVTGIVPENVTAAAAAAKTLAEMASVIPDEGGIGAWFVGDSSVSKFGSDLISLGQGLKGFSDEVTGIVPENVTAASAAAKTLAEMASVIPDEGGIGAWFVGDSSVSKFGSDLVLLGQGLKGFSDEVAGIVPENVTAASSAAKALAEMASVIPDEGGIGAWFAGDNSISTFANHLPPLGKGLKSFSDEVAGIVPENITSASTAAKTLAEMASTAPSNTDNIATFGTNLVTFGEKLNSYFDKISGISVETVSTSSKAIKSIQDSVSKIDPSKFTNASTALTEMTETLRQMSTVKASSADGFSSAIKKIADTNVSSLLKAFKNAGTNLRNTGKDLVTKFIDGAESQTSQMDKTGKTLIDKFIDGMEAKKSSVKTAGKNIVTSGSSAISGMSDKFKSAGKDLGAGLINGINAKKTAVYNAAYALGQMAVQGEKDGQKSKSPSKLTTLAGNWLGEGLIIGMEQMSRKVYTAGSGLGQTATKTISAAISKLSHTIESDIDTQPTIRPVVDLTSVRSGARAIGGLLDMNSSVGVLATVNDVGSMMNRQSQNGVNSEIVSAINKLRKDLANVGNTTYQVNGVTYDDGSNVSSAVRDLVRAAKIERRV